MPPFGAKVNCSRCESKPLCLGTCREIPHSKSKQSHLSFLRSRKALPGRHFNLQVGSLWRADTVKASTAYLGLSTWPQDGRSTVQSLTIVPTPRFRAAGQISGVKHSPGRLSSATSHASKKDQNAKCRGSKARISPSRKSCVRASTCSVLIHTTREHWANQLLDAQILILSCWPPVSPSLATEGIAVK